MPGTLRCPHCGANWDKYDEACKDYEKELAVLDKVLYDVCKQHPDHVTPASVHAKLWIIGRTYATGIERKVRATGGQGSSLSRLEDHLLKHGGKLDAVLGQLAELCEPLAKDKLKSIVVAHGCFVKLLQPLLKNRQAPRSFVSKYMHFHCSAVPLYDSFALKALRKLYPWDSSFEVFDLPKGADEEYGWYVQRFWQLYQEATRARSHVSVRLLDYYLVCVAEDL